jgi:hypothetical protein
MFAASVLAELATGQLQRSKSKESSGMAYDVYQQEPHPKDISTDAAAGPIAAGIKQSLEQVSDGCMSPCCSATYATVVQILKEFQGSGYMS